MGSNHYKGQWIHDPCIDQSILIVSALPKFCSFMVKLSIFKSIFKDCIITFKNIFLYGWEKLEATIGQNQNWARYQQIVHRMFVYSNRDWFMLIPSWVAASTSGSPVLLNMSFQGTLWYIVLGSSVPVTHHTINNILDGFSHCFLRPALPFTLPLINSNHAVIEKEN